MIGSQRDTNPAIINFGLSSSVFQEPQMSLISKALGILSVQNDKTKFTQNSKLAILKLPSRNFNVYHVETFYKLYYILTICQSLV